MKQYTQLTREQRYQIYALHKTGHTQTAIADVVGCCKSTISRELRRGRGGRGYRPDQAQRLADERWAAGRATLKPRVSAETWKRVAALLREDWSPEQIALWLRKQGMPSVSHEWIYQHVYADKAAGGDLHRRLRRQKRYRKRAGGRDRRGCIIGRVGIEERPAIVEERVRLGDWELDTIIGKGGQGAIVTLVERFSRFTLMREVKRKTAEAVSRAIIDMLTPHAEVTLTLTADNGKEFARHKDIAEALGCQFYFARPYASWQRGLNENTNGLIRQYFPKGMRLTDVARKAVNRAMDKLNNRPRKCLGMKTPNEVFLGLGPPVALAG